MKVHWTQNAILHLVNIYEYIAIVLLGGKKFGVQRYRPCVLCLPNVIASHPFHRGASSDLSGRLVPSSCAAKLQRRRKLYERRRTCHGVALAKLEADADTQFAFVVSSASKKQLTIF